MGRTLLQQSYYRLKTAGRASEEGAYAYAIRAAQECVELSLKAALRVMGIEYPKRHDVSRVLMKTKNRFPGWFDVEGYASIGRELFEKRELAIYGDELRMIPATVLFDEDEAKKAYGEAARVYEACEKLMRAVEAS